MSTPDSPLLFVTFPVGTDGAARVELLDLLTAADVRFRRVTPMGGRQASAVQEPAASIRVNVEIGKLHVAEITRAAVAVRTWLKSLTGSGDSCQVEMVCRRDRVAVRLRATDSDLAMRRLPEVLDSWAGGRPVYWNDEEWSDGTSSARPSIGSPEKADPGEGRTSTGPRSVEASEPPRRILALALEWGAGHGGVSTFNRMLCQALAAEGAGVYCVVPNPTVSDLDHARNVGVRLLPARPVPGARGREVLMRVPDLPDGVTPDAVIAHDHVTGAPGLSIAEDHYPSASRIHILHTAAEHLEWHRTDQNDDAELPRDAGERVDRRFGILRQLAREASFTVGVGPQLHASLRSALGGIPGLAEPLHIDPGFDVPAFEPVIGPPEGPISQVLIMGRLKDYKIKGLDIAARALAYAIDVAGLDESSVRLLARGAPRGSSEELRARILKWSGKPSLDVLPLPFTNDDEALMLNVRQSSLVLMPSRVEGFGLVGAEAITTGVPVIVSGQSGLGRLLTKILPETDHQMVLPAHDATEEVVSRWGYAIARVLQDQEKAFRNAARIREVMSRERTWSMAAKAILERLRQHQA
ncbi:glycosyltransferase family 4 protein [Actinomadura decatromicini]|uniref:Glycosyltransferase n=1 Tax=Actinomadura decatromicini TaxID=2604572 RepID=A0A5D3FT32_9ACTN|nr:glycosyltransferase [Actinomadura decatromicini]TYK51363.1 glycosyltransferase [Actinomadura decatromicini]